jgi:hypothetical protein
MREILQVEFAEVIFSRFFSSTSALFRERRTPDFPGFPRNAARVSENPSGIADVQEVEIAEFFQAFLGHRAPKKGKSRA